MEIFGFEIKRRQQPEDNNIQAPSFSPEVKDDGATVVQAGGIQGSYVDILGSAKTEAELVTRYREMSLQPEVDGAIDDIVNEAISINTEKSPITIDLEEIDPKKLPETIKKRFTDEFDQIKNMLDLNNLAYDLFRRWYIDGRLYFHAIINEKDPSMGILELRYIDPRKIRKIREQKMPKNALAVNGGVRRQAALTPVEEEFYIYSERGFGAKSATPGIPSLANGVQGLRIAPDSIVHVTSGLTDPENTLVLSHLHKAIKPLNQLRSIEDAALIYRLVRAPERRVFYVDVGNLPKMKAEQYVRDMMVRYKNRLVYNSSTGEIRDDRRFMTMIEDFWLPRREGGRGTQIDSLPGGQGFGDIEEIQYFQKNLYKSLNVPVSRLDPETGFNLGRASEISRDELKFNRFIERLRHRFNQLMLKTLEKQLILKRIIDQTEWDSIVGEIRFKYAKDNHFTELKELDIYRERFTAVGEMDPFVGKYISREWIRKNILRQTDEDIEQLDQEMAEDPMTQDDEGGMGDDDGGAPALAPTPIQGAPSSQQKQLTKQDLDDEDDDQQLVARKIAL